MLAHKAVHEGKVAAETSPDTRASSSRIPSVAYTDPEVAWMGLTETQAQAKSIAYEKAFFPWTAPAVRCPSVALRALPRCCSTTAASSAGHRRGECRRADRRGVLAMEMGAAWKTSVSPSTRTRRCRKRCASLRKWRKAPSPICSHRGRNKCGARCGRGKGSNRYLNSGNLRVAGGSYRSFRTPTLKLWPISRSKVLTL